MIGNKTIAGWTSLVVLLISYINIFVYVILCEGMMMYRLIIRTTSIYIYSDKGKRAKFVIDNDAGGDDAMAIFLALLYEKHYNGFVIFFLLTNTRL